LCKNSVNASNFDDGITKTNMNCWFRTTVWLIFAWFTSCFLSQKLLPQSSYFPRAKGLRKYDNLGAIFVGGRWCESHCCPLWQSMFVCYCTELIHPTVILLLSFVAQQLKESHTVSWTNCCWSVGLSCYKGRQQNLRNIWKHIFKIYYTMTPLIIWNLM